MEHCAWIREIPEIGSEFLRRADRLTQAKADLRAQLAAVMQSEADLWAELVRAEQWPRNVAFDAMLKMDADVIPYLPTQI